MKNIKTILALILMVYTTNIITAQSNDAELENFRFGLKITPSVNWFKPEGKIIKTDGAVMKFGGGLILEFQLAKVISIQTGLQIDVAGGKLKYNNGATLTTANSNSVSYFYNTLDDKIATFDTVTFLGSNKYYQLNSRNYSITYITIPFGFKMKTKEIGMFTYYGQFGINNSIRWKATAKDELSEITLGSLGTPETKSKIDVTKDVSLYTASLNIGAGAEMNISGSTSLTFGLNYLLGFSNTVKNDSDYLSRRANDANGVNTYTTPQPMPQKVKSNAVVLSVGILF